MPGKNSTVPVLRILIVEDEAIIALDLQYTLESFGFFVTGTAETAEEAVRMVFCDKPDIVLMDIILSGGMDGIQAAEKIREQLSVPIIFCTANGDDFTMSKASHITRSAYLIKPFMPSVIKAAIMSFVSSAVIDPAGNDCYHIINEAE